MKLFGSTLILLALTLAAAGQSARVKPTPTPTPRSGKTQPTNMVYMPTQPVAQGKADPIKSSIPQKDADDVILVDSTLVPIPVTVSDGSSRAVSDLRLSDFELKIDGKKVEIGELSRSESPIRLTMLFDNSSSVLVAREFETRAAVKFFRQVIRRDRDLASLFSVSTYTRLEQRFTPDVDVITRAIQSFPPPTGATALLDGLISAADYLTEVQGRRVVVIVSDGDDTASEASLEQTMKVLLDANCQVYVVKTTDFENYQRTGSRSGNANVRQLTAERRMEDLAGNTGGAVYSPIDERELDAAFRKIAEDLADQYVLSYYPDEDTAKPGEFRQIDLTVKARPNLEVRTRKGYYVTR